MEKLGLMCLILLMYLICTSSVKLHIWFLLDLDPDSTSVVAAEETWNDLKRSELIGRHLADNRTDTYGKCSLNGVRSMMKIFTPQDVNNVHAFIGPVCSYACDLTGMISSVYSIPQVCGFTIFLFGSFEVKWFYIQKHGK